MIIDRVEKDGRWWHIHLTDGHVFVQRIETASATDTPMSYAEELICGLCEKLAEPTR